MINLNNLNKQKIKLVGALIIALIAANIIGKNVFWFNSPRVSPQFIANVKNTPFYIRSIPGKTMASIQLFMSKTFNRKAQEQYADSLQNVPSVEAPASTIFEPIRTGVYAGHDEETSKSYVKIEAGTKVRVQEFTIPNPDGTTRKVTIIVPEELVNK